MGALQDFEGVLTVAPGPFQNQFDNLSLVLPLSHWVFAGNVQLGHPLIGGDNSINTKYKDGRDAGIASWADVHLNGGISYAFSRSFMVGVSASLFNEFYDGSYSYRFAAAGGLKFERRITRGLTMRLGGSLQKTLLGDKTIPEGIAKELLITGSAMAVLPAIQTEIGAVVGFRIGDPFSALGSNVSIFDNIGIGVEFLRGFYITPRFSFRLPLFDKPFGLSAGLSLSLPAKKVRYEIAYGIYRDFGEDTKSQEFRHSISLVMRGNRDLLSRVRPSEIPFSEATVRFNELTTEPKPSSLGKIETLDTRVVTGVSEIDTPETAADFRELARYGSLYLEGRVRGDAKLKSEGNEEVRVASRLTVAGEIFSLSLEARDAGGNRLFGRNYSTDYTPPLEKEDRVDRLRFISKGGKTELIPFSEPFHRIKNRSALARMIDEWHRDFTKYVSEEYVKKMRFGANLAGPGLRVNGRLVGLIPKTGLELRLKPGVYGFTAFKKGYEDVSFSRRVDASGNVDFSFITNLYSVSLYPSLVLEKNGVSVGLLGVSKTLKKGETTLYEEVKSTNSSISVNGYYRVRSIPLKIQNSLDHRIYLMPDFQSRFREPGFWQPAGEDPHLASRFTGNGFEMTGFKQNSELRGKGVQTLPFYTHDFEINLVSFGEDGGQGYVTLVGEGGKKIVLVIQRQKVWAQSDYDPATMQSAQAHTLTGRDNGDYTFTKRDKRIEIRLGTRLLYAGPFQQEGYLRIFFGADGVKDGDSVKFSVQECGFKHL